MSKLIDATGADPRPTNGTGGVPTPPRFAKLIARAVVLGTLMFGTAALAGPSTSTTTTPAKTTSAAHKVARKKVMKHGAKKVVKPATVVPAKAPTPTK